MIAERPRHGYELIKAIEERFGGSYTPSPGVIYPTLSWLDDMGYARIDAEEAGRKLAEKYPGLLIAGTADGFFTDDSPVIERINSAEPDLLLVCLGAPKQELWMAENIGRLRVRLCVGLGGALDVFAGNVKRAPAFFQKLGLEWFYRLLREPRRIKRMIKLPLFVLLVMWKRLRGK